MGILHATFTKGALSGLIAAALIDFNAFRQWKSFHDMYEYQWGTALFRWLQGAVIGGVTALGYGIIS